MKKTETARRDGYLPLKSYTALGDGRSVALSGADGSIDWWCVPNMDSPPLFDRLLSAEDGGRFSITPREPYTSERRYIEGSNVHETVFTTAGGRAKITEAVNSGSAGRLPWCELARRVEGLEGEVRFDVVMRIGTRADTCSPYLVPNRNGTVFNAGAVLGLLRRSDGVVVTREDDLAFEATLTVQAGTREVVAIVAGENEPLVVPSIAEIDRRIDVSDKEWREWSERIGYSGPHRTTVLRSSLALKLLLYSPSGAIAAAATTSLPERIGGNKNYDYRYAWVRDAGYTIKAFLKIGADAEAKAAFTWLIKRLAEHGSQVFYTLEGGMPPEDREIALPGYQNSQPVRIGNAAASQHQHGIYGDIFEVAFRFVEAGNILDQGSAKTLSALADECAEGWRQADAGIWELEEQRHYTMSKISCWQALARAVQMAEDGHLPTTCQPRWMRERDRVAEWIDGHCWSEERQAYMAWAGSDGLDASLALAVRFGFDGRDRLASTMEAIDRELGAGPFHYRYTGVHVEEGCFLACSFWILEAKALLGRKDEARRDFETLLATLDAEGVYPEMIDPDSGEWLGNLPQGLTHLAIVQAAAALGDD
ncbi:glycoside hydrolase family 15 protein [Aureimonas sp. AU12]|uniref:glycoside hydrolase family 15 protein n=1 Tax=Aureimonas sp. AU12 TaxID=1638161 RepID=UPI000785CAC2|nr:glycoside hydrolase family 15 protein [Aureimonas sp. AU12]